MCNSVQYNAVHICNIVLKGMCSSAVADSDTRVLLQSGNMKGSSNTTTNASVLLCTRCNKRFISSANRPIFSFISGTLPLSVFPEMLLMCEAKDERERARHEKLDCAFARLVGE